MFNRKFLNVLTSLIVIVSLLSGGITQVNAQGTQKAASMPAGPTDESKVPHYFGPYPNWANSPFRLPDINVTLTGGNGTGATAAATVDAQTGAVTAITVTTPGSGYTSAPTVNITSGVGSGAAATAVVDYSGVVNAIAVDVAGTGYTAPTVTISGGGATTDATATVYGGVEAAVLTAGVDYSGYTAPTVEFGLPNDPAGVQATGHATCVEDPLCAPAGGGLVTVNGVVVDNPGSGYSTAPTVVVRDGTAGSPASALINNATSTLVIQSVALVTFGSGYTSAPAVNFSDPTGTGAAATATITTAGGSVTTITMDNPGSGYMTQGIKKFTDELPGLCVPPACPTTGKYIPLGVPEAKTYNGAASDEYVIGLIQYHTNFSSSLPNTLVRGYVQIETPANASISQHFPLVNELLDGTTQPVLIKGAQAYGVTAPQWLGPTLVAAKDRPVRIVFYNLLPTGAAGDLFLPVDSSMMGSGMGPMNMMAPMDQGTVMDMVRNPECTESPKPDGCFKDNRATLHLHGGTTPWISDGTTHQWITPAGENTPWPQGVSVQNVPDMGAAGCDAANDGCQTFYYTNQQSARLLFYHDHAWGITRLNVYAGEAAGYVITDPTEQKLFGPNGVYKDMGEGIPLVVQDRTFVPDAAQLALQDPTWDSARWGSKGSFWYHHVYMPAQNPGDPSGMSAYGRWMYGAWFWPPATPTYGPIDNPYYDPTCNLDDPTTWQYQTDPFCEPKQIPGTPNISVGMEQFNDTPIVNGVAYPTVTLQPKSYRLRMLNAANDRFFNFQWYVADPTQGDGTTEVAFKAAELAAAQLDPNVFVTPDTAISLPGPDWVQIGSEGGFLPAPVVIDGQQPTTWITDPTRFDFGNGDKHSLLLAPAERADVIVDFSQFAGKTLILYNDAPAAFPARVASYDYYTGSPDMSPNGAPSIPPGYGPNTRTIMQVKIAASTPAPAFNVSALAALFTHKADGSGVFEAGQHPIIVGQAAYNAAYGKNFAAGSNCNLPGSTVQKCDGYVRINDTAQFSFNTLLNPITSKMTMPLQPKAIHDEMNSTTFDEFGRMQANLGVEAQPPTPGAQNVTLYPFVNPATEIIDGTNLPKGDINVTPISNAADGTQIWRITHNGVDTHPIHFHLFDVQVVNRVTWDNIIIPPDANELGWKDTVRVSPLEDTIVALRPIVPNVPFEVPNAIRPLNPMMPIGDTSMFNNVDPQGNPTAAITNQLVNFGWEYVYHCHILSHEEMDMMRPVSLALPPAKPSGLAIAITGSGKNQHFVISWSDNSINETGFALQRTSDGVTWTTVGTSASPLNQPNTHGPRSLVDATSVVSAAYLYRVVAQNTVGYGAEFPSMTVQSLSDTLGVNPPAAPSTLAGTLQAGPQIRLTWKDNSSTETSFLIQRATDGVTFSTSFSASANATSFVDSSAITAGTTYTYRIAAVNVAGTSVFSNTAVVIVPAMPAAPSGFTATNGANSNNQRTINLSWTDNSTNETGFTIERATNATFTSGYNATTVAAHTGTGAMTLAVTGLTKNTNYYFRIRANNGAIIFSGWVNATPFPRLTNP